MNCTDVKAALWAGERNLDIDEHLSHCTECQLESREVDHIVHKLSSVDRTLPTKSLLPTLDVIRKTVKENRRKPMLKLSGIAVAASVMIAVSSIGISQYQQKSNPGGANTPPLVINQTDVPKIDIRQGSENSEMLTAIQSYLSKSVPVKEVKHIQIEDFVPYPGSTKDPKISGYVSLNIDLQPGAKSGMFTNGLQKKSIVLYKNENGSWEVGSFDYEKAPNVKDSISVYFTKVEPRGNDHIQVIDFVANQLEDRAMTGKAILDVQPGANSMFKAGRNEVYLLLEKRQGVWDVMNERTTPIDISEASTYSKDFEEVAQIIEGGIVSAFITTDDVNGKSVRKLHTLTIKIDQNLSPSDDTIKPGVKEIAFEEELPANLNPKVGDRVILYVAQSDPAVSAGMEAWNSKLKYYFREQNGQYVDLTGNVVDPVQLYKLIRPAK